MGVVSVNPRMLATLANAVEKVEGSAYDPKGETQPLTGLTGTRAYRNNNPGNLRSAGDLGSSDGFGVFSTYEKGRKALEADLTAKLTGNSAHLGPNATLQDLINVYAPAADKNDPKSYAATVAKAIGADPSTPLSEIAKRDPGEAALLASETGRSATYHAKENNQSTSGVDTSRAVEAIGFGGLAVSPGVYRGMVPEVIIEEGLDQTPWFNDPDLIIGNPGGRSRVTPVSFMITLGQDGGYLRKKKGEQQNPIVLQLNASLQDYNKQMVHLFTKTPTRTGVHITMWGMRPDTITGRASTGVFMNQFGLTSFMSVADFEGEVKDYVMKLYSQNSRGTVDAEVYGAGQSVADLLAAGYTEKDLKRGGFDLSSLGTEIQGTGQNAGELLKAGFTSQQIRELQRGLTNNALRVAAQDAFHEFLALFRNNGVTYFHSDNYDGNLNGYEQSSPTAWSPTAGMSVMQKSARNNDVYSKGYVAFIFQNSTYMGYFKSLSWTMDAQKPYQWNFNFVFQVEKEVTTVPIPGLPQSPRS